MNGYRFSGATVLVLTLLLTLFTGAAAWSMKCMARPASPRASLEAAVAAKLEGTVLSVSDGDTLTLLDASRRSWKIRLLGIDAPERSQPFGKVAKQVLSDKVYGRLVQVQVKTQDRYGRTLGKVLVRGVDMNLEMLREGLAWHYKHYADSQFPGDAALYARTEREARKSRTGLWGYTGPVQPWEWRKTRRMASSY